MASRPRASDCAVNGVATEAPAARATNSAASSCVANTLTGWRSLASSITPATDADWNTEYLDPIASVKVVDALDQAIDWVSEHSSHHTDAIMTEDDAAAKRFMTSIDSAIVMRNASTQFADGGEFGMGAEIGIATGKMHARGPVGVEQLTSFKYRVRGTGQIRP